MTTIRVGNAPCSWGSLEFDGLEGEAIGWAQMLDELAATGYAGTELGDWGFMPTDPAALRDALAARGLTMLGAFVPVALRDPSRHGPGRAEAVKVAKLLAAVSGAAGIEHKPFLVLADDNGSVAERTKQAGRVTSAMGLPDADRDIFASGAEGVAQDVLEETGLPTVFHHHCGGYVETPDEIEALLSRTDPALLGLVFDTGHYAFGTGSPDATTVQAGFERFAERIWYVHFKDCDAAVAAKAAEREWDYFESVAHGVFCELGQGCVDFEGAIAWLRKRGYTGWVCVEQDVLPGMGAPRESAQRNRHFLKQLGL